MVMAVYGGVAEVGHAVQTEKASMAKKVRLKIALFMTLSLYVNHSTMPVKETSSRPRTAEFCKDVLT